MEKTTIHQVRQVLMNELGLTREGIREIAVEIIVKTVEKEVSSLDTSGRLDRIIGDQLEKHYRGPLGHWDTFKSLILDSTALQAKRFVENRIKITVDPEPEPVVAPEDKKWSVLLLYPDFSDDQQTFFEHTKAATPEEAVEKIKQMAVVGNEESYAPDDFRPLAVFPGHIEMELGIQDFDGRD